MCGERVRRLSVHAVHAVHVEREEKWDEDDEDKEWEDAVQRSDNFCRSWS